MYIHEFAQLWSRVAENFGSAALDYTGILRRRFRMPAVMLMMMMVMMMMENEPTTFTAHPRARADSYNEICCFQFAGKERNRFLTTGSDWLLSLVG